MRIRDISRGKRYNAQATSAKIRYEEMISSSDQTCRVGHWLQIHDRRYNARPTHPAPMQDLNNAYSTSGLVSGIWNAIQRANRTRPRSEFAFSHKLLYVLLE